MKGRSPIVSNDPLRKRRNDDPVENGDEILQDPPLGDGTLEKPLVKEVGVLMISRKIAGGLCRETVDSAAVSLVFGDRSERH